MRRPVDFASRDPVLGRQRPSASDTEHCPPDVSAAFIWLKNRDPDRWRDVQNVEHVLGKYIISDRPMTEQEWAAERATVINDVVEELPVPRTSSSNVYLLRTQ